MIHSRWIIEWNVEAGECSVNVDLMRHQFDAEVLRFEPDWAVLRSAKAMPIAKRDGWNWCNSEGASYRPLTYVLVAFAALSSMPIFDGLLR